VPSNHDPILLLEPSNLLEPLSLEGRELDPLNLAARFSPDGPVAQGTASTRRQPISVPQRGGRWPLKSALIVAGGLACFGAGTAMPGLSMFGDAQRARTVESATRLPSADAEAPVKREPAKPAESKVTELPPPAKSKVMEPSPPGPSQATAFDANANAAGTNDVSNAASAAAAPIQSAVDRSIPPATDALAGDAKPGATARRADPRRADARRPDTERAQSTPRNRRAAQRDNTDQLAGDDNIPNATASNATFDATPGDARPNRDANRGSNRRRDRGTADNARVGNDWEAKRDQETDRSWSGRRDWATADDTRASNDWGARRDQETDRSWGRRHDRYDDDARDDDRRSSRGASRYGGRELFPFFDQR
jgi:hypothetical protein